VTTGVSSGTDWIGVMSIGTKIYFTVTFHKNGRHGIPESHAGRNERKNWTPPKKNRMPILKQCKKG
jgi:hypothetical protein